MTYILLGILIGWFIPRPKFIGKIEIAIWKPIKSKLPKPFNNHQKRFKIWQNPEKSEKPAPLEVSGYRDWIDLTVLR